MPRKRPITSRLIAPCGMDCGLCWGLMRPKGICPGCSTHGAGMPGSCRRCTMRDCAKRRRSARFCFACDSFPCPRLRRLDKRYRTRYGMSMLENLAFIEAKGIRAFVAWERKRWACPGCGGTLSVHRKECPHCGRVKGRGTRGRSRN